MSKINRRKFIQLSSVSGAFLFVGCVPGTGEKEQLTAGLASNAESIDLNQFISIGVDNRITLFNHRPEMGQGTFQSIPMVIAEELEVDVNDVAIKQSAASRDLYGSQMVVGSRSIQTEFAKLRTIGAATREMLKQAAAEQWGVSVDQVRADNGKIISDDGYSLTYGELVEAASTIEPPAEPPLKSPSDFQVIGKSMARRDIPLKTNGEAQFGIDVTVPDMLYASIERSPVFLGKVISYNQDQVLAVPGVKHVFKTSRQVYGRTREGVAVLADTYWNALQGRKALQVEWDNQGLEKVSGQTIMQDSYQDARKEGDELFGRGNASRSLESNQTFEATYETPYQAHVPMEPMNAIVSVKENSAEFWGSTQNPNGIKSFIANKYGLNESSVKINYTFMGGGFGRRSMTDVAEEAADLSKQSGKPVKVIWTREDDQTQGPFRACSLNVCKAVMNNNGTIEALEHKVIAQEIRNQVGDNLTAGSQLMGGITTDYQIPNLSVKGVLQRRHIPISYWRAVYHSTNPFAHESFIDELAHRAGRDPIQFRLDMLDHPRFERVLTEARKLTNWDSKARGSGKGVAMVERSGAHFAMVAEVSREGNGVKIDKITTVIDLGICVNPDTVKAQTEGSIVMGLGAMFAGLTIERGAVVEQNWNSYKLPTIGQIPEIETFILESDAPPDGAGESGLPTVAPALANAIFDLTGKRIRSLPVDLQQLNV